MYCVTNRSSWRQHTVCLLLGLTVLLGNPLSTYADGAPVPRVIHAIDTYPYVLWRESWGGGDALADSWSVYSGSTFALTGDIEEPGWRLRSTSGYGRYRYRKLLRGLDGPTNSKLNGLKTFSTLLLGHQLQWQRLTIKAFGGLASALHRKDPRDPDRAHAGMKYGGKAALEAWLAATDTLWLAGDLSWIPTFQTYKLGLRSGVAVRRYFDLGLEAQWQGDKAYKVGKIGGFATWRHLDAGLTVAAGATGNRDRLPVPYGRISLFLRY